MSEDLDSELLTVCRSGTLAQAKKLVADGANPNCLGKMRVTPLMRALESKQSDIVRWLVSKSTVDVDRHNSYNNTALHYACRYSRDSHTLARLANRMDSASVNLLNRDGNSAVFSAVEWSNVSALQGLLSVRSVNWMVEDKNGRSLLDLAR